MSLTLIIGSMFSGKTTELQRLIQREECIGRKVLVINHSFDKGRADDMTTHAGVSMKCISLAKLGDLQNPTLMVNILDYETIAINEGQFFDDLEAFVKTFVLRYRKTVFVSALDSDYTTKPFANVMNLIPHADKIMKLQALCMGDECRDGTPALYSYRKTAESGTFVVGGADKYMPMCRTCYLKKHAEMIDETDDLYLYKSQHTFTDSFISKYEHHYEKSIQLKWDKVVKNLRRMEDDILLFINERKLSDDYVFDIECMYEESEMDQYDLVVTLKSPSRRQSYKIDNLSILNKYKSKLLNFYFPKQITDDMVKEIVRGSFLPWV